MPGQPVRRGRVGSPRRIGWPPSRADDRRELASRRPRRAKYLAALADDLADRPCADHGKLAPEILGDCEEERLDHLGRATELGAEVLTLGGDPRRARVEVALARHV